MGTARSAADRPDLPDRVLLEAEQIAVEVLGATVERLDTTSFLMRTAEGETVTVRLGTFIAETALLSDDERRHRLVSMLAVPPSARPSTWDEVSDRLLPAVRSTSWANALAPERPRLVLLPFVELLVAVDSETRMAYCTAADLERWDVDVEDVLFTARANLVGLAPPEGEVVDEALGVQRLPELGGVATGASDLRSVVVGVLGARRSDAGPGGGSADRRRRRWHERRGALRGRSRARRRGVGS